MESTNDGSRLDAVGVDVSKASLDAHRLSTGESRRFANDAQGIEELARWVGDSAHRVVYESTGRLHRELEARLAERLPLAEVNPLRARLFAKAAGRLAKTDKVDAKVLALMGATLALRRVRARREPLPELEELVSARDALMRDRTRARNRLHQSRSALLRHQHRNRLRQVARQVKAVEARIRELTRSDAELSHRAEVLSSIAGIGRVTAATLLAEMPELGAVGHGEAASLAGLAPWTRESGQWAGRRFIGGGRARPRQAPEGGADGGHAQARDSRQRPAPRRPPVDPAGAPRRRRRRLNRPSRRLRRRPKAPLSAAAQPFVGSRAGSPEGAQRSGAAAPAA